MAPSHDPKPKEPKCVNDSNPSNLQETFQTPRQMIRCSQWRGALCGIVQRGEARYVSVTRRPVEWGQTV